MTQVSAKLELMVAQNLCPVVDKLETLLALEGGAVTAADAKTFANAIVAERVLADRLVEDHRRQAASAGVGRVQAGKAQGCCRCGCRVKLRGMRIVAEIPETEIRQQAGAEGVVEARGQAVVFNDGLTGQADRAETRSADCISEDRRTGQLEVRMRVAAEDV